MTKPASKLDYTEYVVCVDVRQYHQVRPHAISLHPPHAISLADHPSVSLSLPLARSTSHLPSLSLSLTLSAGATCRQVFAQLTDMRDNYLKAHVLFAKNMKKLADPRGDGDGKSANVMSMF